MSGPLLRLLTSCFCFNPNIALHIINVNVVVNKVEITSSNNTKASFINLGCSVTSPSARHFSSNRGKQPTPWFKVKNKLVSKHLMTVASSVNMKSFGLAKVKHWMTCSWGRYRYWSLCIVQHFMPCHFTEREKVHIIEKFTRIVSSKYPKLVVACALTLNHTIRVCRTRTRNFFAPFLWKCHPLELYYWIFFCLAIALETAIRWRMLIGTLMKRLQINLA